MMLITIHIEGATPEVLAALAAVTLTARDDESRASPYPAGDLYAKVVEQTRALGVEGTGVRPPVDALGSFYERSAGVIDARTVETVKPPKRGRGRPPKKAVLGSFGDTAVQTDVPVASSDVHGTAQVHSDEGTVWARPPKVSPASTPADSGMSPSRFDTSPGGFSSGVTTEAQDLIEAENSVPHETYPTAEETAHDDTPVVQTFASLNDAMVAYIEAFSFEAAVVLSAREGVKRFREVPAERHAALSAEIAQAIATKTAIA